MSDIKIKPVPFNLSNDYDAEAYEIASNMHNYSKFVKDQLHKFKANFTDLTEVQAIGTIKAMQENPSDYDARVIVKNTVCNFLKSKGYTEVAFAYQNFGVKSKGFSNSVGAQPKKKED